MRSLCRRRARGKGDQGARQRLGGRCWGANPTLYIAVCHGDGVITVVDLVGRCRTLVVRGVSRIGGQITAGELREHGPSPLKMTRPKTDHGP